MGVVKQKEKFIAIQERHHGPKEATRLPLDAELDVVNAGINPTSGLWSAKVVWAGTVYCVLRERKRGTIEAESEIFEKREGKRRIRTRKYGRVDAIKWARRELFEAYMRLKQKGELGPTPVIATGELTWREFIHLAKSMETVYALDEHGVRLSDSQIEKNLRYLDTISVLWPAELLVGATSPRHIAEYHSIREGDHLDWEMEADGKTIKTDAQGKRLLKRREHRNPRKRTPFTPYAVTFPASYGRRNLPPCEEVTATGELRALSAMVNKLIRERDEKGNQFLAANPFESLSLGGYEKRKLEPATTQRYVWTLKFANQAVREMADKYPHHVYVPGLFRCMLAIAFHTGHRISAIGALKISDLLLDRRSLENALGASRKRKSEDKMTREWAAHWPHGAIYWRRINDKEDFDRVIPVNATLRKELLRYLSLREAAGIDTPWLFPRPLDPYTHIRDFDARDLLYHAEGLARAQIQSEGLDPDALVPDLFGRAFHAYRALWEGIRFRRGWAANKNSSYAGGWTTKGVGSQENNYNVLDPVFIQGVVDGKFYFEVVGSLAESHDEQAVIDMDIPDADDPDWGDESNADLRVA